MEKRDLFGLVWGLALSALLVGFTSVGSADEPKVGAGTEKGDVLFGLAQKEDRSAVKRWIGVACEGVPDALRAHLDLSEGQGLLVMQVVSGSPAEKAGLVVHDVLLEVNGKAIKSIDDLVKAVDESDDGIELKWIHKGETRTKAVSPVERPGDAGAADVDAARRLFLRDRDRSWPFQMRFMGPAFELRDAKEFPKDLKIEIKKHGDQPAEITVEKGDQKWQITEEQLNQLPEDVRSFVEPFVGGDLAVRLPRLKELEKQLQMDLLPAPPTGRLSLPEVPRLDLEKRLDQINSRIDELRKELGRLRGGSDERNDETPKESGSTEEPGI